MKTHYYLSLLLFCCVITITSCAQTTNEQIPLKIKDMDTNNKTKNPHYSTSTTEKLNITNSEWSKILPADVYDVSRNKGTERPFTGKYNEFDKKGTYHCVACGNELFKSDQKFASTCGWPSFFEQTSPESITYKKDNTHGMMRTEILCGRCEGHLGHLFDDGPAPTGKRYCMNSIVMDFIPEKEAVENKNTIDTITLGGGCYWCVEAVYEQLNGVVSITSGFSGGNTENPTYEDICTGTTNHAEVIEIVYDKSITSLEEIFKVFFTVHDPTTLNRQGNDVGTQYRSIIFYRTLEQGKIAKKLIDELEDAKIYSSPIVTTIEPATTFYKAPDYHQNYYQQNKEQGYCRMVIQPKLEKFEKVFKDKMKK